MNAAALAAFIPGPFRGLVRYQPTPAVDARGSFLKIFHQPTFAAAGFDFVSREDFHSVSRRGVLRGMHFQVAPHAQAKIVGVQRAGALRQAVAESIDLDFLARQTRLPFYVAATHIASGSARLFTGQNVTLDALMASACLPELFAAVEIEGEEILEGLGKVALDEIEQINAPVSCNLSVPAV